MDPGYDVDRGVFMGLFSLLFVLSFLQSLTEFLSPKREVWGTVRWAAHRFGVIGPVFQTIQQIDYYEVFGIYTAQNRLDFFFAYAGTTCLYVLAASAAYSILRSDSMIVKEKPPIAVTVGYTMAAVSVGLVSVIAPAYAVGTGSAVPRPWFLGVACLAFGYCGVTFLISAYRLLGRMTAVAEQISPSMDMRKTKEAIKTLRIFCGVYTIICVIAVVFLLYSFVAALGEWKDSDPEKYDAFGAVFLIIQVLSYTLSVVFTWAPLSLLCKPAVGSKVGSPPITPRAKSLTVSDLHKNSKNSKNNNGPPSPSSRNRDEVDGGFALGSGSSKERPVDELLPLAPLGPTSSPTSSPDLPTKSLEHLHVQVVEPSSTSGPVVVIQTNELGQSAAHVHLRSDSDRAAEMSRSTSDNDMPVVITTHRP